MALIPMGFQNDTEVDAIEANKTTDSKLIKKTLRVILASDNCFFEVVAMESCLNKSNSKL